MPAVRYCLVRNTRIAAPWRENRSQQWWPGTESNSLHSVSTVRYCLVHLTRIAAPWRENRSQQMVARDRIELPTRGFSGPSMTLQPNRNAGCSGFEVWHNSHLCTVESMSARESGTKLAQPNRVKTERQPCKSVVPWPIQQPIRSDSR